MKNKNKKMSNKILMTIGLATVFLAMFNMGSSEEKRTLRHLATYDTVSVEEYKLLLKEHLKEFSLFRCKDYGITGYDIKVADAYLGTFYSIEHPDKYMIELAILASCAKDMDINTSDGVYMVGLEDRRVRERELFKFGKYGGIK